MHDAIVVGGGPAGLQAALTLGRMHRDVLVLDSGAYRNAPAAHMHNFVTHDGRPPAEFRELARADLSAYETVTLRELAVVEVGRHEDGFVAILDDGTVATARSLLLATGVRDVLPEVPGLADHFGTLVHHCPFCHGHELAGQVVGVQEGPRAAHLVPMLSRIAADVLVVPDRIERAAEEEGRLVLVLAGRERIAVDGFFAASGFEQAAPFAAQLGLDLLDSGCIEVDAMGRTSEPGVYAAGDLAHPRALGMPMASVLNAAAAGQLAAGACVGDLLAREHQAGRAA